MVVQSVTLQSTFENIRCFVSSGMVMGALGGHTSIVKEIVLYLVKFFISMGRCELL